VGLVIILALFQDNFVFKANANAPLVRYLVMELVLIDKQIEIIAVVVGVYAHKILLV